MPQSRYSAIAGDLFDAWVAVEPSARPTGATLALALEVASRVAEQVRNEETVEVVWTGPSSHEVPVRRTAEVVVGLINEARQTLWITSFAAYKVPIVLTAIAEAASRGVDVRLVLETVEDSGGALSVDGSRAFARVANSVAFYIWPKDRRPATATGRSAMHAKAVVVDNDAVFATSANLTGHAMDDNMELGLLVRGGSAARVLAAHFRALAEDGELRRVDAS